jgi:hypothetical protein
MQKVNGKYPVRIENCIDCGNEFIIVLEEFIQKTESGMRLPKRCVACRKKRRYERDPYAGWLSTLENIQQLKVIVIVYMAADNERKVSNNEIF